ncbi:MAG: hypothetical protein KBT79_10005 [Thalassolituus oleivorans]|nr:hypothetical protein [Thalassolituus oleivorans]
MITLARIIIGGWILVVLAVIGAILGFVVYSNVVMGISLKQQASLIRFDSPLTFNTDLNSNINFRLLGDIPISVPLNNLRIPFHIKGQSQAQLDIDSSIPLNLTADFSDTILIETDLEVAAGTELVSSWLPNLPVRGTIPIRFELPVAFTVPVNTSLPLSYHGPISFYVNQTITPNIQQTITTSMHIDQMITAPVTNTFYGSMHAQDASIPITFDNVLIDIPLENIKYSYPKLSTGELNPVSTTEP